MINKANIRNYFRMAKTTKKNNNDIEKLSFDCQTKEAADEFKADILAAGVLPASVKVRKIPKSDAYRMVVDNSNDEIHTIINMLMNEPYALTLEEIQDFLKIKFVLPEK